MNSSTYVKKIFPTLKFKLRKHRKRRELVTEVMLFDDPSDFILEQNHASVHDSHETQEWLLHQGINFISSEDSLQS